MGDPIGSSLSAIRSHQAWAPAIVFGTGALTSTGPCVAPRFIAIAGLCSRGGRAAALLACGSFAAGLAFVYAAFAAIASLLPAALWHSRFIYALIAAGLLAGGVLKLWRDAHACRSMARVASAGAAAPFLLGAGFGFVVSPCCAPMILGILSLESGAGDPARAAMLLACFAAGHALPLFALAFGASKVADAFNRPDVRAACSVAGGSLLMTLGAYFAVLA